MKTASEIRNDFIEFFKSKEHTFVKSAPVAPQDDPTLMFTNAGMNQFKSIFLGENKDNLRRATNSQKCMRVSGKHNDLEEVGVDHHHHTLFEMLGNWSFGDYYKKEAIAWAWELLTEKWGLPKDKLYATIYEDDAEAGDIWREVTDVDHDKITLHGAKDNFWEMGETGPCGPCSEIHFDTGEGTCIFEGQEGHVCEVNGDDCGRYVEIWNLVFMQYNRQKDGSLQPLPSTHVDTGMGFERIVRIIQGGRSNYDSDLFMPIIEKVAELSGEKYGFGKEGIPFRVIADHMRALVIAITDGVFPSNEGRGYVLRRLLRRAYRYGRNLGFKKPFMYTLVPSVISILGDAFPEIKEREEFVTSVIKGEEERFGQTLETGIERFNQMAESTKKDDKNEIDGTSLFQLYDTYGFPVDLTRLMADEIGMSVDEAGFEIAMNEQRERARAAQSGADDQGLSADGWIELLNGAGTKFIGYDNYTAEVKVSRFKITGDKTALAVFDKTPFYAEMGGQVGDNGILENGSAKAEIVDTISWNDMILHKVVFEESATEPFFNGTLVATIDSARRNAIRRNHTATHLLQAALTTVLGDHVSQSGSRCDDKSLRFDFTHFSGLTDEELIEVEDLVNGWAMSNSAVSTNVMSVEDAKESGAKALFGEKYGDEVRVVSMGNFSSELCGGVHADSTGNVGTIIITSEASVSSGVRRIEAVTGFEALDLYRKKASVVKTIASTLKVGEDAITGRFVESMAKIKKLESDLKALTAAAAGEISGKLVEKAQANSENGLSYLAENLGSMDKDEFSATVDGVSDAIRQNKIENIILVLAAEVDGKVMLAACSDKGSVAKGIKCGDVIKATAKVVNGGGGGSPVRAMAGGKSPEKIDDAMKVAVETIKASL